MLRRSLCALAAVAGLSIGSTAQAQPSDYYRHHQSYRGHEVCRDVRVFYRGCATERWRYYGEFGSEWQAHAAAGRLRARGLEVSVRISR